MRLLISVLVFVLHISITFGQTQISKTEIIIIGTIHTGNEHFNHKTLYKVLERYNPDIILGEDDTDFKRVFGLRTAHILKIWKPSIEQLSLQKYSRHNKDIKILPFDTAFVSRRKYKQETSKMHQRFFDSLNRVKMTFSDSTLYADYANKRNQYYNFIANADLYRINKPDVMDMTKFLYDCEQNYILPLGKKYILDSLLVKQFEDDLTFWFARNNYMSKQIQTYSKRFLGKRIIVLTGLNHKYYLLNKLREQESRTINIIEIESN